LWKDIHGFETHPILGTAAKRIPEITRASKSKNTRTKYDCYFEKFISWCKLHKFEYLPAKDTTVSLFLSDILGKGVSHSVIDSYFYSIKWNHDLMLVSNNPCDSKIVKLIYAGSRSLSCQPVVKKSPVTVEILRKIVEKYGGDSNNLKNLRLCTMCILGFSGFFRYDELSHLQMNHLSFHNTHVSVKVTNSKTDQKKLGSEVIIAKLQTKLCPVSWLLKYIAAAGLNFHSEEFLFTKVRFLRKTNSYVIADSSTPLSYTRAREIFRDALDNIGEDKSKFGLHSLRSGGASALANSSSPVESRMFKKHGRWKSDSASDGYVHYNLEKRLEVSKKLGL
jgi:integrase